LQRDFRDESVRGEWVRDEEGDAVPGGKKGKTSRQSQKREKTCRADEGLHLKDQLVWKGGGRKKAVAVSQERAGKVRRSAKKFLGREGFGEGEREGF